MSVTKNQNHRQNRSSVLIQNDVDNGIAIANAIAIAITIAIAIAFAMYECTSCIQ